MRIGTDPDGWGSFAMKALYQLENSSEAVSTYSRGKRKQIWAERAKGRGELVIFGVLRLSLAQTAAPNSAQDGGFLHRSIFYPDQWPKPNPIGRLQLSGKLCGEGEDRGVERGRSPEGAKWLTPFRRINLRWDFLAG